MAGSMCGVVCCVKYARAARNPRGSARCLRCRCLMRRCGGWRPCARPDYDAPCDGTTHLVRIMQTAQQLIAQAYEQARRSGKQNWNKMTTAVLKNRLLDLTGGTFDEAAYGADTFMDFVLSNEETLVVDRSTAPPLVELRNAAPSPQPSDGAVHVTAAYRIRPDLWKAALDYSSGTRYVWDVARRRAVPSAGRDGELIISTVTEDIQRRWRQQFIDDIEQTLTEEETDQIDLWLEQHLGVSHLPVRLVSNWNRSFCDSVRKHLLQWFAESNLQPPDDIVSTDGRASSSSPETEALRELVLSIVRKMTRNELSGLTLPSESVLRATRSSRS